MWNAKVTAYPRDHNPAHIHVWIPADNFRDGRYLYPSSDPYRGAGALSRRKRDLVNKILDRDGYRKKIRNQLMKIQ
jgi:hypothetical protein